MSLPAELRNFVCCPKCGENVDLEREGPIGERGIPDSKYVVCGFCGTRFATKGGTMWENMGHDGHDDVPF